MHIVSLLISFIVALSISLHTFADDPLCAVVKIEIAQELTLERQAFKATMRITNSLDTLALEDVNVSVFFNDAEGNPVTATSDSAKSDAAFFIRKDIEYGISNLKEEVDGKVAQGIIPAASKGEIHWLIIPTAGAAKETAHGRLYYVGATLNYTYGGKSQTVNVSPDSILVKPQPKLRLDYFLTREVIGDDAFTSEIEPPVPYTLGVRILNTGAGIAKHIAIESAQPRIVENKQGLPIGFDIISSYVGNQPAEPTLLLGFGDLAANTAKVGRWQMETNLSGIFDRFSASFTHADELGGELTSLLDATEAHFLIHNVQMDLPGRDTIPDFLTIAGETIRLFESEVTGEVAE
ncbi:calcium-binding protein, partial [Zooshikella sp. WH53]|nr:calcium-binding protein [Zooshikella harenae]